jgi:hypothetical protein
MKSFFTAEILSLIKLFEIVESIIAEWLILKLNILPNDIFLLKFSASNNELLLLKLS